MSAAGLATDKQYFSFDKIIDINDKIEQVTRRGYKICKPSSHTTGLKRKDNKKKDEEYIIQDQSIYKTYCKNISV